jgi:hypothetical protein
MAAKMFSAGGYTRLKRMRTCVASIFSALSMNA